MKDALLNRTLRLTIVGTISVTALACLILAYTAIFELFAHRWADAASRMVWSAGAALAALLLTVYRGELIDD
jgi:hypothetical protein